MLALLLEQYLGTAENIKANSIAGILLIVGRTLLIPHRRGTPAIGKGPYPLPPPEALATPDPLLS